MKKLLVLIIAVSATFINSTPIANESPDLGPSEELAAELRCMELNLYYEARGEGKAGMLAVGHVTLNRAKSKNFPNTICGVVYQPWQFSWVKTKKVPKNKRVPKHIREIAYKLVVEKKYPDNTAGSLFFHNHTVGPFDGKFKKTIGNHIFYS
jgi:spore germination cell wall hydrolase CwlJ-like protein